LIRKFQCTATFGTLEEKAFEYATNWRDIQTGENKLENMHTEELPSEGEYDVRLRLD
jgi:hypothetical protein